MEWRQQTTFSHSDAFIEAQRWIEEVTGKAFVFSDFRASLENGVLLCDLINQLKPGIIKRLNRLSTPIAGLDNVNVFLKACEKFGLNESQLFHPGDLQDLSTRVTLRRDESNRRLKNVLITIYWLGRKAHLDTFYVGPRLNVKAFEGLLGLALSKSVDESSNVTMKDGGYSRCPDGEEFCPTKVSYERENSMDSVESLDSRAFQPNSEGCGSDAEAEQVFRMETTQNSVPQTKGRVPALVKSKQGQHITSCSSPFARSKSLSDIPLVSSVWKVSDGNTVLDVDQESATARERNHENKRRAVANDGEAQWHDDLTKWKNRRRSTNSDLRRKSQDREHVISQMTNGAVTNEARGGGLQRDQPSPCSCATSMSKSSSLRPHLRHGRPNTAHKQESAIPASNGDVVGEDVCYASPASNGAGVTTPSADGPFHSLTQVKALGSSAASQHVTELVKTDDVVSDKVSTLVTTKLPHETESSRTREPPFCEDPQVPTRGSHAGDLAPESVPLDSSEQKVRCEEEGQRMSSEPAKAQSRVQQPAGNWKYLSRAASWSSASLPRGFRRSEGSSRLSSVITARPFDTKLPRASSVHGLCSVNDSPDLSLNCETDLSVSPQTATSQLKNGYHHQQTGSKGSGPPGHTLQAYSCTHRSSTQTHLLPQLHSMQSQPRVSSVTSTANVELPQVDHSDLRLSLTLKPSSRVDFGFQTRWESTGLRVQCVQPGSPAELCQLCTNDEVVAVDGVSVAHMSPGQWEEKMTSALQTGSLTMDIRRYGNKDWNTSERLRRHPPGKRTLNLSAAAPLFIGCPDRHGNVAWSESSIKLSNGQRDNVKVTDGDLASGHKTTGSKGGSESAVSDNNFEMSNGGESAAGALRVGASKNKTGEEERTPNRWKQQEVVSIPGWQMNAVTALDREKSLSTPTLTGPYKQLRVDQRKRKGECVSTAQQERQQILEEMKKRTQLLHDNSWIRQRSSSFYKEPIIVGVPLKRYESLDNLDALRDSSPAVLSYPRPHSAAAGHCSPSRNACSRYSTGALSSQKEKSLHSHVDGVWAATNILEEQTLESRSRSETGSLTVGPATSNLTGIVGSECENGADASSPTES